MMAMLDQLILNNFPQIGVSLAFGYGSKVIKQSIKQEQKKFNNNDLVDIIFVVDDPLRWHHENYARNNQHYSFLRYLPNHLDLITKIQENYGAKIYFNSMVNLGHIPIKYGIINTDHLIEDLLDWNKLYVAGRLHKPVEHIVNTCDSNEKLKSALRFNRESAIRAALLQLPETFNSQLLYKTIVGLSYNGDVRMMFGEDKNKIDNIVAGQINTFDQIYNPIIKLTPCFKESVHWNESKQLYAQDLSPKTLLKSLKLLPKQVRKTICHLHSNEARTKEADIVLGSMSRSINCDKIVSQAICIIVRRSSLSQSFKGLLTAGLIKSIRYSQRKLIKSIVSRF